MKKSWYPLYKCLRPRSIINPYTHERIMVGCDKCAACMQRRSARSQLQIRLEAKDSYKVIFGTLTFANTYVPRAVLVPNGNIHLDGCEYNLVVKDTGEILGTERLNPKDVEDLKEKLYLFGDIPYLYKRDAQLFIKRLRKYLSKHYGEEKIRYYICGEYAPEHFRPHFHFLIFLQSSKFLENSGKVLSDFPQWTWEHTTDAPPNTPVSKIENAIRSSWQFGSVQADIAKGDTASYVSGYVAGSVPLPKIFKMRSVRPFSLHSQFLGVRFLKSQRTQIYQTSPRDFVYRSFVDNGVTTEYVLWRSAYAVFFPKCKGYSDKSSRVRLTAYRLYAAAMAEYGSEIPLIEVSSQIAEWIYESQIYDGEFPSVGISPSLAVLIRYFLSSLPRLNRLSDSYNKRRILDSWICSIYSQLLLSKHFLNFVCNGDYSIKVSKYYLQKIEDFYDYIEQMRLADFYKSQQDYYGSDYVTDETLPDIEFFYDNGDFDFEKLQQSEIYQRYVVHVNRIQHDCMKHRIQNERNMQYADK